MEKPEEIKNRTEKKITLILQSFNSINLIVVQERLMKLIKDIQSEQEKSEEKEEDYVWINTFMEVRK